MEREEPIKKPTYTHKGSFKVGAGPTLLFNVSGWPKWVKELGDGQEFLDLEQTPGNPKIVFAFPTGGEQTICSLFDVLSQKGINHIDFLVFDSSKYGS